MLNNIDVYKLSNIIGSINLIDIRSIEKYNSSHIDTSINIPVNILLNNPDKYFNKNDVYYLYCQKGITSPKVCKILYAKGYRVINIIGGYESWLLK